jgi:flagellar motor component MotA
MTSKNFEKKCRILIEKAMNMCEKSRREGLMSLIDELDDVKDMINERDVFYYGLALAADGFDRSMLEKILNNLVNQETDDKKRKLKIMQKEAVMSIKNGDNPQVMLAILLSLVPPSKFIAGEELPGIRAARHHTDEEELNLDDLELEG